MTSTAKPPRGASTWKVDVAVEGEFGAEGEGAKLVVYQARVKSAATQQEVRDLLTHTDSVAEVHNTLRAGTAVTLEI